MPTPVGTVSDLRRYPVKSMLGEQLERVEVTERGIPGDRAHALIDDETGKIVSVKRPKRWGRMFELVASSDGARVRVAFPDGTTLAIDDPELRKRLSDFFGRPVSIVTALPSDAAYDEAWAGELKDGAPPYMAMETTILDDEEFINGGAFMRADQNFFDFGVLHVVATGSTKELARHAPDSRFDPRRFRPNIVVDTPETGFLEKAWQGRALTIGNVRLTVGIPVPRCVMTTLAQGDLPPDREVLRSISMHNGVDILSSGTPYPCLGVYADVSAGGEIALGDTVTID